MPALHRPIRHRPMRLFWGCLIAATAALTSSATALAAPTAEQRQEVKALETAVTKAGNLYKDGKHQDAAAAIRDVQARMEKLLADGGKEMIPLLESLHARLVRAHALLELEGVELPELKKLEMEKPAPAPAANAATSFVKNVAPVLVARCGRCHVSDTKGEFAMDTFANLMKGPPAGVVLFPGDPDGSRLIEVIESGDMPRGGGRVGATELATLKNWIKAGAKFDGEDPSVNLSILARSAQPDATPALTVTQSTGNETVKFARHIAPILVENCTGCHIGAMRPRGNFNMTTFQGLLRGGDSGPPLVPGKPQDSLLWQKLTGKAGGERMPMGRPPLSDELIAKIETWIKEGAAYDGLTPNQDIAEVAAIAKAKSSSHAELTAERLKLASQNWRLGMPGIKSEQIETEHFLVMGNFGEASLQEYGKLAEAVAPKIAAMFKAPSDQPLVKGRTTLYFFADRYSYGEFGKMVEQREIPKEYRGHWRFSVVDAYGAAIPPRSDEYNLESLVAQQVAGVYVASLGKAPRWFAEGAARVAASRITPHDPRLDAWENETTRIVGSLQKPDDFMTGKIPQEEADIASYQFVKFLMKDAKRFENLLTALRSGRDFDKTFPQVYGAPAAEVAGNWLATAAKARPTKRPASKKNA